jgi:hypothetical protein
MKKNWKIITGGVLVLLVVAVVAFGWLMYKSLEAVWDSYAEWDVALACIHHMKKHAGSWPKNWSELESAYKTTPDLRGPHGWQDVTNRVDVDFAFVPSGLARHKAGAAEPPARVIWLRNGKTHYWTSAEPNALVFDYLKTQAANQSPPATSAPAGH